MLIKCPECDLQISDKAIICPHCGYPLKNPIKEYKPSTRKKRLPNGFGQISFIKGNLRKPYRAMITVGFNELGHPISKILKPDGYFKTYNEAYSALIEYHKNPYDLDRAITVSELYEKWSDMYFKNLNSQSSIRTISSAWAYCSSIASMRVMDVRARHIKFCMEEGMVGNKHPSPGVKGRIKSLFNLMLDYAVEYEIVDRNYARTFDLSGNIIKEMEKERRGHMVFTDEEMSRLWKHVEDVPYANIILIQCYMGWRPQELGLIELDNVDFEKSNIIGGMKTKAGTGRTVPIHPNIRDLIISEYNRAKEVGSKYLFIASDATTHKSNNILTYDKYKLRFAKVMETLEMKKGHRPHDPRKHFVSMAKKYNVDEYAIKKIVGHEINDITEKIYTERDPGWLMNEICKIR